MTFDILTFIKNNGSQLLTNGLYFNTLPATLKYRSPFTNQGVTQTQGRIHRHTHTSTTPKTYFTPLGKRSKLQVHTVGAKLIVVDDMTSSLCEEDGGGGGGDAAWKFVKVLRVV